MEAIQKLRDLCSVMEHNSYTRAAAGDARKLADEIEAEVNDLQKLNEDLSNQGVHLARVNLDLAEKLFALAPTVSQEVPLEELQAAAAIDQGQEVPPEVVTSTVEGLSLDTTAEPATVVVEAGAGAETE